MSRGKVFRSKAPIILANLLLLGFLRRHKTSADIIHKNYALFFWRQCRNYRRRLFVIYKFIINPITMCIDISRWTLKAGRIAAIEGKPIIRQIFEQLYWCYLYSIDSESYYLQEFYRRDGSERAKNFVNKGALKYGIYNLLGRYGKLINKDLESSTLGNKLIFEQYCQRHEIPTVPILMQFKADGMLCDYRKEADRINKLPEQTLFCKPIADKMGKGAEVWFWQGGNCFRNTVGETLELEELEKRLCQLAEKHFSGSYIVQPLILPHPELEPFRKLATPTIRIITYIDTKGIVQIDRSMFRFSRSSLMVVDNASAGGMVAPIDKLSGKLGQATESGLEFAKQRWTIHQENGTQIEGRQLPLWKETCSLVLKSHSHFPHRLFIGWDVIIAPDGPVILEGNSQPGLCYLQKAHLTTFGKMDSGKALAHHSEQAISYLYSGVVGDIYKNEGVLDLYSGSIWKRCLGWLRLDPRIAVILSITGRVQGVFFRKWLKNKADKYKVSGWVSNCPDGSVKAVLCGKGQDIEDLVNDCWLGPADSLVESVRVERHKRTQRKGFYILRGAKSQ